jgi:hypothetical protein
VGNEDAHVAETDYVNAPVEDGLSSIEVGRASLVRPLPACREGSRGGATATGGASWWCEWDPRPKPGEGMRHGEERQLERLGLHMWFQAEGSEGGKAVCGQPRACEAGTAELARV